MKKRIQLLPVLFYLILTFTITLTTACSEDEEILLPSASYKLAGDLTTSDYTVEAFNHPPRYLDTRRTIKFSHGNSNFEVQWTIAGSGAVTGLGPTFNAKSCSGCHVRDGRGRPPEEGRHKLQSMLIRLSRGNDPIKGPLGLEKYAGQLQDKGIDYNTFFNEDAVPAEGEVHISWKKIPGKYADGVPYELRKPTFTIKNWSKGEPNHPYLTSPRTAPHMSGLGLLAALSDKTIEGLAERQRYMGVVSGKVNRVWDVKNKKTSIGRFGWKANAPNLEQQISGAFAGDMGITSPMFPDKNCPPAQTECNSASDGNKRPYKVEANQEIIDSLVIYNHLLGVPARRNIDNQDALKGERTFKEIGCAHCHIPTLKTRKSYPKFPELENQIIHPYTDMLVHDMGEGLADNRPDFLANGNEWRTPPLWGIGMFQRVNKHTLLLHDGRARGFAEAILWHGGEAETSKERFRNLSKKERDQLVLFLKSL